MNRIQTFNTNSLRTICCQSCIAYRNISCAVNSRGTNAVGNIISTIDHHCSAASVTSDCSRRLTVRFYIQVPSVKSTTTSYMNTTRGILSRFHNCTRSIYSSITICKKPCSTCCICSHAAIFHISSTICCQNSSSYTIEAGIVSALAVCRSSCNGIIITFAPEEINAAFSSVPVDSIVSFDTVVSSIYSFTAV